MSIEKLNLRAEALKTFSLAAHQNAYPLLRELAVEFPAYSAGEGGLRELGRCRAFEVRMTADPISTQDGARKILQDKTWQVQGGMEPGQTVHVPSGELEFDAALLGGLTEEWQTTLRFTLAHSGDASDQAALPAAECPVSILPENYWGGESRQPELLAAFVRPNGKYVASLVKQASKALEENGYDGALDGYQAHNRQRPFLMGAALWQVIRDQKISYVTPPPGFAVNGQRIVSAAEISVQRMAGCLDLSLLFAACLERMGLHPVVALTKEHACVGFWLIDYCFPILTNNDPMDLRKRIDMDDLVLLETTLATGSNSVKFNQAREAAKRVVAIDKEEEFVYLIDIGQARVRGIKPLGAVEAPEEEKISDSDISAPLPEPPPLPKVQPDEQRSDQDAPQTPDARVEAWEKKLLDLSRRNRFLNLSDRAVSIPIYCPDIGLLEDRLSQGKRFSFVSAEHSPLQDPGRDSETFRLTTGNDLHREYALQQLENNVLVANQNQKGLEKNTISLLRKAKTDLEEGGANTLFLTLGMLRWKEDAKDKRACKAPLILLPVQLVRKSARSKISVRQLADEEPVFNPTLLEFLRQVYAIDLFRFADQLPLDEHGVDVAQVWYEVRQAVQDVPGFEVVEDLVLASFSFTKYLMWKDLCERTAELKKNLFVRHLIDHPHQRYRQNTEILSEKETDAKVDPREVFTPMNCDSAQLVAVEASGRPQDFVLEGPPGTGKSETIANIICHNLALGRKALFVAEKMAALSVVHRRISNAGLDHLCLELHSNKANKKAVIAQLKKAWEARGQASHSQWKEEAGRLKALRDKLNHYVQELHRESPYGLSAYDAIARVARHEKHHRLELGWPNDLHVAPVQDESGVKEYQNVARELALAFDEIVDLDADSFAALNQRNWSHAWQSEFIGKIRSLQEAGASLRKAAEGFVSEAGLPLEIPGPTSAEPLAQLAGAAEFALAHRLGYALRDGAVDRLERLRGLADRKQSFDCLLEEAGSGLSAENIASLPSKEWAAAAKKAAASKGILGMFRRWRMRRAPKKFGLQKIMDLSHFDRIAEAGEHYENIEAVRPEFEEDGVWSGWDVSGDELRAALKRGEEIMAALAALSGLSGNPAEIRTVLHRLLVEQRDFLNESSSLVKTGRQLQGAWNDWESALQAASEAGYEHSEDCSFDNLERTCRFLLQNERKFKRWCDWLARTDAARTSGLERLVDALVRREIPSQEAEQQAVTALCRWLAPILLDDSDVLREFSASGHQALIEQYRDIDERVAETTSQYIAAAAAGQLPDPNSDDAPPEFDILAREMEKKTRHKPVRTLIKEVGEKLTDLMPCMMMSPLSVSQFLPTDFAGFDLVVFDEASQITPWDAVGAIARGRNVIVVGDPKQLPPTSFFSRAIEEENEDYEDLESILDQALSARLPHLRLKGHYRSRHETLIAFSNSHYYENSLITFPSAETRKSAVHLKRVKGLYSKGKGRNNPIEAQAVADEIVRRLTDPEEREKTIGVVTLNTEQQRTIEDCLETARRSNPAIEKFFNDGPGAEPVFVKNLESVQGDERDVIMLSLGYGPTEPGAQSMSMNFGPLNKPGGERRLNVAVTRSRCDMLVFSSFDSSMIDLSRTSATGVEHLKNYLKFADVGPSALAAVARAKHGVDQFDSDFEQGVAAELRARGWDVQTQVGVGKFRIDLGVIHPEMRGEYLAGVECDGVTYHSSPSARDRDRIRQIVLENLGWNLIRLWSIDYFNDGPGAIDRIDRELKALQERSNARAASVQKEAAAPEPTAAV